MPHPDPHTILWLIQGSEGYGVATLIRTELEHLQQRGLSLHVFTLAEGALPASIRAMQVPVTSLELPALPSFVGGALGKAWRLVDNARRSRSIAQAVIQRARPLSPDALRVCAPNLLEAAGSAARTLGCPCLWELPCAPDADRSLPLASHYYRWICQRHQIIPLAASQFVYRSLQGGRVGAHLLPHTIPVERFDPARVQPLTREALGLPEQAVVVGVFAGLYEEKGQHVLWQAILDVALQHDDLHLLCLGGDPSGPYAERLRTMGRTHGAAQRLHLLGQQPDPQCYYSLLDFHASPRAGAEPFGISVVEGMLMQRPALVHALGGPAETVVDGVSGWHVMEPTPEAFRAGLRRALQDRPRWRDMGREGRRLALLRFDPAARTDQLLEILRAAR